MLRQGVEDRRIITVHPSERTRRAVDGDIERVAPEDAFYVYKQQHCRRCGSARSARGRSDRGAPTPANAASRSTTGRHRRPPVV